MRLAEWSYSDSMNCQQAIGEALKIYFNAVRRGKTQVAAKWEDGNPAHAAISADTRYIVITYEAQKNNASRCEKCTPS